MKSTDLLNNELVNIICWLTYQSINVLIIKNISWKHQLY